MSKKLSIIVLYYNEPLNLVTPMLDCLEGQLGIDWDDIEIIFSSSSVDVKDIDLTNYPKISSVAKRVKQNTFAPGPGASQQVGMDVAEGEYIWRLDIDDVLVDRFSIFYVLYNIEKHNHPNVMILSCIGPDACHHAPTELTQGVPVPMAAFLWVIKTSVIRDNNIRFCPYTMVWEDVNFATLLWDNLESIDIIASTEEFIYEHFDRKDSTFYTQYRYKPFKVIQDCFIQFLHNITTYANRNVPPPYQVFHSFNMAFETYYPLLPYEWQKQSAMSMIKAIFRKYSLNIVPHLRNSLPDDIISQIFDKCLLIKVGGDANLDSVLKTLNFVETQLESETFSLSKLQIVCFGAIPEGLRDYDFVHNFPIIGNNIFISDVISAEKLFQKNFIIPYGMALLLEAGSSVNQSNYLDSWFISHK